MVFLVKNIRDGLERFGKNRAAQVHGHLPREDDIFRTARSEYFLAGYAVETAHRVNDAVCGKIGFRLDVFTAFKSGLRVFFRKRQALQAAVGFYAVVGAFEDTDIRVNVARDKFDHLFRH